MQANSSNHQQHAFMKWVRFQPVNTWQGKQGVVDEHFSVIVDNVAYVGQAAKMVESAGGDKIVLWFLDSTRRAFLREDCTLTHWGLTVGPPPQQPVQQVVPVQQGHHTQ